jgi:hypothetical protein
MMHQLHMHSFRQMVIGILAHMLLLDGISVFIHSCCAPQHIAVCHAFAGRSAVVCCFQLSGVGPSLLNLTPFMYIST